jgi:hypothetical protein
MTDAERIAKLEAACLQIWAIASDEILTKPPEDRRNSAYYAITKKLRELGLLEMA